MNIKQPPIQAQVKNSNVLAQNRYSILRSVSKNKNHMHGYFLNQNGLHANTFHIQNTQNYYPKERAPTHLVKKHQHQHRVVGNQTVSGVQDYQRKNAVEGITDRQNFFTQSLQISTVRGNSSMRLNEKIMPNSRKQLSNYNFVNYQNKLKIDLCNSQDYRNLGHNPNSINSQYRNINLNVNQNITSTIQYFDDNEKSFIDDFRGVENVQATKQDYARVVYQKMAVQQCLKRSKAQIISKDEIIKQLQAKLSKLQSNFNGNYNQYGILNNLNSSEYRKSEQSHNAYQFQWKI